MANYSAGIDYSLGMANVDKENGIHYGVMGCNSLYSWWEVSEPEFGGPTCMKCGTEAEPDQDDGDTCMAKCGDGDPCGGDIRHQEDPIFTGLVKTAELFAHSNESEIWFEKSPYFTYCAYCSPCCPGAGDLDSPRDRDEGIKAYCPPPDWFDSEGEHYERQPFDIYSVSTGELVCKKQTTPKGCDQT